MALVSACAPTPTPGPPGRILVTIVSAEPENPLFEPVHRARVVAVDGSLDVGWRLQPGAAPVEIPSGMYRLEAYTVFLSDTIVCGHPIGEPNAPEATCFQPTLGPEQVCAVDIEVPAGGDVHVAYEARDQGLCDLRPVDADPT
jgi:hypothetical protein